MTRPTVSAQYQNRIDAIRGSIEAIWGNTDQGIRYLDACARAYRDLDDIGDQRGLMELIVPVVGSKNAGKSTFCRLLITDPEAEQELRVGYCRDNASTTLTWLGTTEPARMDPQVEVWKSLSSGQMFDAGAPYALVDVPGFNDANPAARAASLRVMSMASVIVLVASSETLEVESLLTYLRESSGATIVPVVVDDLFETRPSEQIDRQLREFRERVKSALQNFEVAEPIRIPRIDAALEEEQSRLYAVATRDAQRAIQQALGVRAPSSEGLARARFDKLLQELSQRMKPFLEHVAPHHDGLLAREKQVIEEIIPQLIGDRHQLYAGIRAKLFTRAAQSCSGYWFPFRSFLHLLALTAGAWDRLIFALSGSFPSLALLLFQGQSNFRRVRNRQKEIRASLLARIEATATAQIAEAQRIFIRSVHESIGKSRTSEDSSSVAHYRVRGLPAIESMAQTTLEHHVASVPIRRNLINTLAVFSVIVWVFLATGPVTAVYSHFLSASGAALTLHDPITWEAFPVPSFRMMFVSALLVFAPVFVLAMITLRLAVRSSAVEACSNRVLSEIRKSTSVLVQNSLVLPYSEAALKDAVQHLRQEFQIRY